jgi:acetyl esterase
METNLLTYPRFLALFLRLKLLNLTSRFPPHPGGALDEQTALMRRAQLVLGETFLDQVDVSKSRQSFRQNFTLLKSIGGIFEKVDSVRDLTVPGPAGEIPCRLYRPDDGMGHPVFVFLHGGGWVIGDLDSADNMARYLCKHVNCAVLSVDYRLAPEHVFPAAVEDCYAALAWAAAHAAELGGDPNRLLVGGDSAGGNLAAVVAQMCVQKGGPTLAGQVLFYAATDGAHLDTPSHKAFGGQDYGLPTRDIDWFLNQYVPDPKDRLNPLVSPLLAKDLHSLAPALVVTAEYDVLRDEGEAYARRMEEAGVKVKLMRCNGMVHGFLSAVGLVKRGVQYFEQAAAEIRRMAEGE